MTAPRRLSGRALAATTFFVVSGGPYGLEELVQGHGYRHTLALLVVVPLIWSIPVALMVGELASALPEEGGYYAWVRRALGPFWGVQEAWLSLACSLFDMALYPTLFVAYVSRAWPGVASTDLGQPGWWCGVAMIALGALWNLRGARSVGRGSTGLGALLLAPFALLAVAALVRLPSGGFTSALATLTAPAPAPTGSAFAAGLLLCLWNYLGFDNASTIAREVDDPARTYPRAMLGTVALVAGSYVLSVLAASVTGLPPDAWETGAWVQVAGRLGGAWLGPVLGALVVIGGALSAFGMFSSLLLVTSRLPTALAAEGWLPRWFAVRHEPSGAPRRAIVVASLAYAACLTLGLRRLVEIDVALYGTALLLEFIALVALRLREPALPRPFRVPGGLAGAVLVGIPPTLLLLASLWVGRHEPGALGLTALDLSGALMLLGPLLYLARRRHVPGRRL